MQSIIKDIDSLNQRVLPKLLDVSLAVRQKNPYCSNPQVFIKHYIGKLGRNPKFPFEESHNYDPKDPYYCSNVCFIQKEKFSSAGHAYPDPKNNTYTLCPYCDPFIGSDEVGKKKLKKRDGQKVIIEDNEPKFFDTLHSEYEHHMSQVHGIKKTKIMAQPFVGYSMTQITKSKKPGVYKLSCICPYAKGEKPCLAEFNFRHDEKSGNPYKAYFRHVNKCHFSKASCGDNFTYQRYIQANDGEVHPNIFIPLDVTKWYSSLQFLQTQCGDENICPILNEVQSGEFMEISQSSDSSIDKHISLQNPDPLAFLDEPIDGLLFDLPAVPTLPSISDEQFMNQDLSWLNCDFKDTNIPDQYSSPQITVSKPLSPVSSPSPKKRKLESVEETPSKRHISQDVSKESSEQPNLVFSDNSESDSDKTTSPPPYSAFELKNIGLSDFDGLNKSQHCLDFDKIEEEAEEELLSWISQDVL